MKYKAYFVIGSDTHWFRLNDQGALIHVMHRFEEPSAYTEWSANEPISHFSMIPKDGMFHILAKTRRGIYYLKCLHNGKARQEISAAPYPNADHPYLFFAGSALYVCYMISKEAGCFLVIKTYKEGAWRECTIILSDDDTSARLVWIEDIAFAASQSEQLYCLFRYRNDRQNHVLALLQYDLGSGERMVYRLFAAKNNSQSWKIGLGVDPGGNPHISWTIRNGETVTYYCTNLHQAGISCRPLFLTYGQEPESPYFLFMRDIVVLLFASGGERVQWVCSANGGITWSPVSDIGFQPESRLRFVQGVKEQQSLIVPVPVLGFGAPYLRPLEWADLFNPFLALKQLIEEDRNNSPSSSYNKNMHLPSAEEDWHGNSN